MRACENCDRTGCESMARGPNWAPDSYFCCWCQGYEWPRDQCDNCRPTVEDAPERYS